jgi:replication factor C small subunit
MEAWTEKYRPETLDDMAIEEDLREMLRSYVKKETLPNLLLYGKAGLGKTSLAKVLAKSITDSTVLYINASDESGVDTVRNKIKEFSESIAFDNGIKIVILDEADGLSSNTAGASAQGALRNIIESSMDDTRYILTCNYINKIIDPIKSRCTPFQVRFTQKQVIKRVVQILKNEGIDYKRRSKEIALIVKKYFPDIRKIINIIEQCSIKDDFTLQVTDNNDKIGNVINFILENINNPRKCREFWIANETLFDGDYINLCGELFNSIENPNEMLLLGENLFKMNNVLDVEIQFYTGILQIYNFRNSK